MPKAKSSLSTDSKNKSTVNTKTEVPSEPLKVPEMTLLIQDGEEINTSVIFKEKTIIFLYPKANTPGCTKQACGFRDSYDAITQKGYQIYGLSADSPKSQLNWKTKYELPFNFICDPEYKLIKFFGASKSPKGIKRSVVILDNGVVVMKEIQISPLDSVSKVLEFI